MESHDIFLVFVEGSEGNEEAYAEWFSGTHMSDMLGLPGVLSAKAYRLASLDGGEIPAQLCAIYDTVDGPGILDTIAAAKGTDALPASELQGRMTWRVLEGCEAKAFGKEPPAPDVLICMFGGPFIDEIDAHLYQWLCSNPQGIGAVRQTRLSPVQPSRGSEYGSVLLVDLTSSADPSYLAQAIADHRSAADSRFLLARPSG